MLEVVEQPDADAALVRDSARTLAARLQDHKALRAGRFALPWHGSRLLRQMVELGWFGTLIPSTYGGLGLGLGTLTAITEELGAALLAEPLVALAVLGPRAILRGDNEALKALLLPSIAEGKTVAVLAWQEGRDDAMAPHEPATTATRDENVWRLTGRKRFVAGSWAATDFIVSARSDDGLRLFLVKAGAAGLQVTQEWRADGSPVGLIELEAVVASDIVAGPGCALDAMTVALNEGAIVAAAELLGVARAALRMTIDYMRTRVAFGRPIASFQALQHRAADLHVAQELADATLGHAVRVAEAGEVGAPLRMAASRVKARCNDAAMLITREAIQLHGGIGITDDCDIGLYLKRALVVSAALGTTAMHHARISQEPPAIAAASDPRAAQGAAPSCLAAMQSQPVAERDWNSIDDEDFRACAREFLESRLPPALRFVPRRLGWTEIGDWYLLLSREGWLAPTWPAEHGGMGLGAGKLIIYYEELERVGGPRLLDHGINNVGAILLAKGTPWQRATYLPKVLTGEHIWCQGYSEPNAGSDLASLRTSARLEGDDFVVTGQKIWTTLAHQATHIYALVRTDATKPGRDGISFLLIDLRQPGVTIRPIRNIAGHDEFCEVFLDGVRTHRDNLVGGLNDGWAVSRAVLGFERLRVGSPRNPMLALQRLTRVAQRLGLDGDPLFRDRLVRLTCDVLDLGALYERAAEAMKAGNAPGPEASVLKILATETEQRLTQSLVEVLGDAGTIVGQQDFEGLGVDVLTPFFSTRATSIYGGTNEIQRNIIARRILRL